MMSAQLVQSACLLAVVGWLVPVPGRCSFYRCLPVLGSLDYRLCPNKIRSWEGRTASSSLFVAVSADLVGGVFRGCGSSFGICMPAHLNLACLQHTTFPSGEGASFGRGVVVHLSGVLSWCFSPGVSALGSF